LGSAYLWIFVSGLCLSVEVLAQGNKSGEEVYGQIPTKVRKVPQEFA
jgi:hypothetical protein